MIHVIHVIHVSRVLIAVTGNCLPVFGKKDGESCYMDTDCETGYVCEASRCQVPAPGVGQFGTREKYL